MSKQDVTSNQYLLDKARFADLLNVFAYGGKPVIAAEDIHEISPVLSRTWWENGKLKSQTNITDGSGRVAAEGSEFRVYLQNQADGSLIMPVRVINTDAIDYYNQWKNISKAHNNKKDLHFPEEKFSGFSETDRLCGVITIVIYYGRKPWKGAKNLNSLVFRPGSQSGLQRFVADYPINILDVRRFPHPELFRTDLRQIFTFLQKDGDKDALLRYVEENRDFFYDMPEDAFNLLAALSNIHILKKKRAKYINKERGRGNMCKALEDLARDCRQEGRQKGRQEGETRLSSLGIQMQKDNRLDEFLKALDSRKRRKALFKEYGM